MTMVGTGRALRPIAAWAAWPWMSALPRPRAIALNADAMLVADL
jgi:hypothetical protein